MWKRTNLTIVIKIDVAACLWLVVYIIQTIM